MLPGTELSVGSQYWQSPWRWIMRVSGIVIFVFVIAQFIYGLCLHNRWVNVVDLYGQVANASRTLKLRFTQDAYGAVTRDDFSTTDLIDRISTAVPLDNCSSTPANLGNSMIIKLIPMCGIIRFYRTKIYVSKHHAQAKCV